MLPPSLRNHTASSFKHQKDEIVPADSAEAGLILRWDNAARFTVSAGRALRVGYPFGVSDLPVVEAPLERDPFFRTVVVGSSAFGLGMLFASLSVLEQGDYGFQFHWTLLAIPAFLAGAALGWAYWRMVFLLALNQVDPRVAQRRVKAAVLGLLVIAILSFLYPLRFVSPTRRGDVLIGLSIAVAALSTVGFFIWTVARMLQSEADQTHDG